MKFSDISTSMEIVEKLESAERAVEEIGNYKEIGMRVHGQLWGLTSKVSLISVVLPTAKIFIFDMVMCPVAVTETNLGKLLESEELLKVSKQN